MTHFLAAVLCVTLIATFPKLLTIAFDYVKGVEETFMAYILLISMTLILPGLIAYFMWIGHRAQSSGFDELLHALGKSIGREKEKEVPMAETNKEENGIKRSEATDESNGKEQQKTPNIATDSGPGKTDQAVQP